MTTVGAVLANSEAWPEASLSSITQGEALVLAPHPDDESLGCGGLIAAACASGQPPLLVMLTDGAGSHPNSAAYPADRLRALRETETLAAAACLGLAPERVLFLRYPDTAAPAQGEPLKQAAAAVAGLLRRHGCRSLFAPWRHDPHCDHEAAARIAASAATATGMPHWAYPVWSRTLPPDTPVEPTSGVRLSIAPWQAAKRRAIRCHRSQWDGVITDDPGGFQMEPGFMALFDTAHELYLRAA